MTDSLDFIIAMESDPSELSDQDIIDGFQELIDSGLGFQLQGSWGRACQNMIDQGHCHA